MIDLYFRLRDARLSVQLAVLIAVVLCLFAVVAPIAARLGGTPSVVAAAVAAGLCLAGACIALTAANLLRSPNAVLYGMLIGMIARMAIPLGIGVALHFHNRPLADAGLLVYLLVFYPLTLGVETALAVPRGNPAEQGMEKVT